MKITAFIFTLLLFATVLTVALLSIFNLSTSENKSTLRAGPKRSKYWIAQQLFRSTSTLLIICMLSVPFWPEQIISSTTEMGAIAIVAIMIVAITFFEVYLGYRVDPDEKTLPWGIVFVISASTNAILSIVIGNFNLIIFDLEDSSNFSSFALFLVAFLGRELWVEWSRPTAKKYKVRT